MRAQQSCELLAGVGPAQVITREPDSNRYEFSKILTINKERNYGVIE